MVASYCSTFLEPEMLHIYRQITGLERWRPVVITRKRKHAGDFPFPDLIEIAPPRTRALRRLWVRQLRGAPVQLYGSEVRAFCAELEKMRAEVLHIYFGHIAVQCLPLIRRATVPVVVSFHGADAMVDLHKPAYLRATREMLGAVRMVLVRSESLAERLREIGCAPEKIRIHRTGIPLEQLPFRERTVPEGGAWRFLQACRLIEKKGLPTSLAAFAKFAGRHPRATLTLAGEGPMREELGALAEKLGVGDRVFFPGFVSQETLRALFYETHFFLHPSELGADGNQEGVPNAMLEAMATGLPPLATTHGGIPEAVEHGVSGMLVEERDAVGLGEAALALADDPARYAAMGRAAAEAVAAKFERRAQAEALEYYYDEARAAARLVTLR